VGSRHADKLLGDAGANSLDGHLGNDLLTGRGGADAFVFSQRGFGRDTITDFTSGEDHLDLRALGLDWSQVAIASNSAGAVVSCAGGEIWLSGVSASLLTQDDFLF
jgi:Ca2+-binding RTX toxin-like protein